MKILLIHARKFWWKVREPARVSIRDQVDKEECEVKNALIAFITVEEKDELDIESSVKKAVNAVIEVARRLDVKKIVLYPYAHLSKSLSKPKTAIKVINIMKDELEKRGFEVHKSPFGYYKEFILHCIGHPLAESLRII